MSRHLPNPPISSVSPPDTPAAINARLDRSRLKAMSSPLLAFLRTDPTIIMLMMPLSNRPITLGRKNYLFCGNHEAAGWMSVICSLIGTCKEQDVNPRMYLNDIIAKMPYIKTDPLNDPPYDQVLPMLPHLWIQSHPEAKLDTSNQ